MRIGVFRPSRRSSMRDLKAVLLRQDDVEEDDVVVVHVGQQEGLVAVRGDVHHVTLFPQTLLDESRDFAVVFHHEDFHGYQSRDPTLSSPGSWYEDVFTMTTWREAPA